MADGQGVESSAGRSLTHPVGHTVDIDGVTHRYGAMLAVDNVTVTTRAGEVMALLGPSGCGKTTLLRIIAGFVRQTEGLILIDGRSIDWSKCTEQPGDGVPGGFWAQLRHPFEALRR